MASGISGGGSQGWKAPPRGGQEIDQAFVPIKQSPDVEEAGRTHTAIEAAVATDATGEVKRIEKKETKKADVVSVRKMSQEDVVDLLLTFQKMPTKENLRLVMMMLQYGVEISSDNLEQLIRLTKGDSKKSAIESGLVSLMKGLTDSPKSADVILAYLQNNQQFTALFRQLMQAMQDLQSSFPSMRGYLEATLLQAVTSVFDDLQKEIKRFLNLENDASSRGVWIKNLKALSDFMGGLMQRFNGVDDPVVKEFLAKAAQLKQHLKSALEQFASHAILSKDNELRGALNERFHYWQIPNPFVVNPTPIDILVKKDGAKSSPIDPDRATLKLKFNTDSLGDVCVDLKVEDKQVRSTFRCEKLVTKQLVQESMVDLNSRMTALNYQLREFKSIHKHVDIQQFLLPKARLTDISRVSSEV